MKGSQVASPVGSPVGSPFSNPVMGGGAGVTPGQYGIGTSSASWSIPTSVAKISDGTSGTIATWIKTPADITGTTRTLYMFDSRLEIRFDNIQRPEVVVYNTAGVLVYRAKLSGVAAGWHQVVASWRLDGTPVGSMYVDGANTGYSTLTGPTTGTCDFTGTGTVMSAIPLDAISQVFFDDKYYDLSTNISKFYNSGYVDLGVDGTASGLTAPKIYYDVRDNDVTDFLIDRGTAGLGNLTLLIGTPTIVAGPNP